MIIHIVSACCKKKMEVGGAVPAKDLYQGTSHLLTKEAVSILRGRFPDAEIRWSILSVKYGFVDENELILPYEDTKFRESSVSGVIEKMSSDKKESFEKGLDGIIENSDVTIICMGNKHNKLCNFPHRTGDGNVIIVGSEFDFDGYKYVTVNDKRGVLHASWTDIKGVAMKVLSKKIEWGMDQWEMRNILLNYNYSKGWE